MSRLTFSPAFPFSSADILGGSLRAASEPLFAAEHAARERLYSMSVRRESAGRGMPPWLATSAIAVPSVLLGMGAITQQPEWSAVGAGLATLSVAVAGARKIAQILRESLVQQMAESGSRLRTLQSACDIVTAARVCASTPHVAYPSEQAILRALHRQDATSPDAASARHALLHVCLLVHGPAALMRVLPQSGMTPAQQDSVALSALQQVRKAVWPAWISRLRQIESGNPEMSEVEKYKMAARPLIGLSHVPSPDPDVGFLPGHVIREFVEMTRKKFGDDTALEITLQIESNALREAMMSKNSVDLHVTWNDLSDERASGWNDMTPASSRQKARQDADRRTVDNGVNVQ